jgi:hypothetical protein
MGFVWGPEWWDGPGVTELNWLPPSGRPCGRFRAGAESDGRVQYAGARRPRGTPGRGPFAPGERQRGYPPRPLPLPRPRPGCSGRNASSGRPRISPPSLPRRPTRRSRNRAGASIGIQRERGLARGRSPGASAISGPASRLGGTDQYAQAPRAAEYLVASISGASRPRPASGAPPAGHPRPRTRRRPTGPVGSQYNPGGRATQAPTPGAAEQAGVGTAENLRLVASRSLDKLMRTN